MNDANGNELNQAADSTQMPSGTTKSVPPATMTNGEGGPGDTGSSVSTSQSGSLSGSNTAPLSTRSGLAGLTAEERLRRVRLLDEQKHQERLAAFIEAQKQAELNRQRVQEERKRMIEQRRQREAARHSLVLERRNTLQQQATQAKMESLRDRSRPRCVPPSRGRADYATSDGSRAASAAPSVGLSDQHAAHLMTRSCVVAFGSSAPRSICTRPSPAALRLQQAFEARLASYLSGRHSGCFLTSSSSPHYMHYIDPDRNPHLYASLSRKAGARQPPLPPSSHTADARRAVSTPRAWHSKTADSKVAAAAAARQQQATASDLRSSAPHPNLADATGKGQPPSSAEVSARTANDFHSKPTRTRRPGTDARSDA